jgi:hypothetical protein
MSQYEDEGAEEKEEALYQKEQCTFRNTFFKA